MASDQEYLTVPPRSPFERHFQTFIGMLVIGACAWLFNSVQNQTVAIAVQTTQIQELTKQIDALRVVQADRYTARNATRDFAVRDAQINSLTLRVKRLEDRPSVR